MESPYRAAPAPERDEPFPDFKDLGGNKIAAAIYDGIIVFGPVAAAIIAYVEHGLASALATLAVLAGPYAIAAIIVLLSAPIGRWLEARKQRRIARALAAMDDAELDDRQLDAAPARSSRMTGGSRSAIALASRPRSPFLAFQASPAAPCRYAAHQAASNGGSEHASAPASPASTSPDPAVASEGLPVEFTTSLPSGAAMTE
jgi:hypothetical protein